MARNINDIYQLINYIFSKQLGDFISPEEVMPCLDAAQLELFEEEFKAYSVNQTIVDSILPFKTVQDFTANSSGVVSFQPDYMHLLAGAYTTTNSTVNPIRFVTESELPYYLTNQLRPVLLSSPCAVNIANGFQLFPASAQTGKYSYMKRPVTPVLSYTVVSRVFTYNSGSSVQLQFSDAYINNIISRALKYIGISLGEEEVQQFAQQQTQITS
jgi:hypothetical protein